MRFGGDLSHDLKSERNAYPVARQTPERAVVETGPPPKPPTSMVEREPGHKQEIGGRGRRPTARGGLEYSKCACCQLVKAPDPRPIDRGANDPRESEFLACGQPQPDPIGLGGSRREYIQTPRPTKWREASQVSTKLRGGG